MTDSASTLAYASAINEMPEDRLLRRIVAFAAIIYASLEIIRIAARVALARHWAASPSGIVWNFEDRMDVVMSAADAIVNLLMFGGGVLLLRCARRGIPLLRVSSIALIVSALLGLLWALHSNTTYATYWSTPASAISLAIQQANGSWFAILILLLTLPPLARRMVGEAPA